MSRLEEIKSCVKHDLIHNDGMMLSIPYREVEWLIGQAELTDQYKKDWLQSQKKNDRLQNKIDWLEKQNNELTGVGGMWMSARNKLEATQKINNRYKQALEFYAKRMHYSLAYWATGHEENVLDYGEIAHQALKESESE